VRAATLAALARAAELELIRLLTLTLGVLQTTCIVIEPRAATLLAALTLKPLKGSHQNILLRSEHKFSIN